MAVAFLKNAVRVGDVAVEGRAGQLAAINRMIGHDLRVAHQCPRRTRQPNGKKNGRNGQVPQHRRLSPKPTFRDRSA
jgi:hypothetical protein